MQSGVEHREVAEVLRDVLGSELLLACNGKAYRLGLLFLNLSLETYLFEIQYDVYYTLDNSGDNRTLRRALPIVIPYPGSSGRNSNLPKVSVDSSMITLSGF